MLEMNKLVDLGKEVGNMKGIPVVVLSRNFATGLSVVRSLGAAGHTADLVLGTGRAENTDLVAVSKYVPCKPW